MGTVRQLISEVRNDLNAISVDGWIPGAYIYYKAKDLAATFLKRDQDDRRMQNYSDIWTVINCMDMEEKNLIECCGIDVPNCETVMVSVKTLPEVFASRYGYLLKITSADYGRDYIPIAPEQFKYTQSREYVDQNKRYFWLSNGRIYIPKSLVRKIKVRGIFPNKYEALKLNCDSSEDLGCIKFLDQEFTIPNYILGDVKKATVLAIAGTRGQIAPDELANSNQNEKTNPKL